VRSHRSVDQLLAEVLAEREQLASCGRVEHPIGIGEGQEGGVARGLDSEVT
jgi:hypothetical protein